MDAAVVLAHEPGVANWLIEVGVRVMVERAPIVTIESSGLKMTSAICEAAGPDHHQTTISNNGVV
jgi:hypothetical protein